LQYVCWLSFPSLPTLQNRGLTIHPPQCQIHSLLFLSRILHNFVALGNLLGHLLLLGSGLLVIGFAGVVGRLNGCCLRLGLATALLLLDRRRSRIGSRGRIRSRLGTVASIAIALASLEVLEQLLGKALTVGLKIRLADKIVMQMGPTYLMASLVVSAWPRAAISA
jgi:hypothetical protein